MRTRDVGKFGFLFVLSAGTAPVVVSCGAPSSTFSDAGPPGPLTTISGDASLGTQGSACTPKTCESAGYTCGWNGDGCGGIILCGESADGGATTLATSADAGVPAGAGSCPAPEFCGGGGYSRCGTTASATDAALADGAAGSPCVPRTCEGLGYDCGWAADGCGGLLLCGSGSDGGATTLATSLDAGVSASAGSCTAPEFCGGGGPNVCGGNTATAADGATIVPSCTPQTCTSQNFNCGLATDGCGNPLPASCGSCTAPEYCGGGGPNVCGGSTGYGADGGTLTPCIPKTCGELGFNCGPQGDGCGNLIPSCGTCTLPAFCGGGGAGVCGGSVYTAPDGGTVNLCTPTNSCASLNFTCGQADDGCGNVLQCGTCTLPDTCGGGGVPGQCGRTCAGDAGLCQAQQVCDSGTPTTITGTVLAGLSAFLNPNAPTKVPFPPDPVPNVLVYIPNSPVAAFTAGAACRQCGADVSGSPLVSTYTNFDGTFTLAGVPTPASSTIPLVIQLGRWRRQFTIATPTACATTAVSPVGGTVGVLNLPSNHTEGDIPLTAVSTGNVDALECVLLKMGVDQAEFTSNTPPGGAAAGRINIYAGGPGNNGGDPGASVAGANPETSLMGATGTYMNYDQILFPCWGAPATKSATELANLVTYANNGGHFFATHYSYSWLINNGEFNTVANWDLGTGEDEDNPGTVTWDLNVSTAVPVVAPPFYSGIFYQWLNYLCLLSNDPATCAVPNTTAFAASATNPPEVAISSPRFDVDSVANGSIEWIGGTDQTQFEGTLRDGGPDPNPAFGKSLVEHFTFNTPVGATSQCGHAIYSDFHVANVSNANGKVFPAECTANSFTAQEKILEYMLFDLASCVTPPTTNCTPITCSQQNLQCGVTSDGCGDTINCGSCPTGETCGGGGTPGVCGAPDGGACVPETCSQLGYNCGPAGNGCGNLIPGGCGTCPSGQTCGGGGTPGVCGAPDGGSCVPQTCASQNITCGPAGDGCGNLIATCGSCPEGQVCGGSAPGQCGIPDGGEECTPETCASQGISCGPAGDGCGNLIASCGTCPSGQTCGGGGQPGQCGSACVPLTCAELGYNCGPAGNGCGGQLQCGTCEAPATCGGGGQPSVCGTAGPR